MSSAMKQDGFARNLSWKSGRRRRMIRLWASAGKMPISSARG